jgi:antitoxin PrlF
MEANMTVVVRKVATVTEKGQTTVPKSVRDVLGLGHGDRIAFSIDENSRVSIERDDEEDADPVIASFLDFLARDMQEHPSAAVTDIPDALRQRIHKLTNGMSVDIDAPIEGDVDI